MTNLNKMKKSDIIKLMEGEGMMFSRDLTKDELIKLHAAQSENQNSENSEEETEMENLQNTAAEVVENSQEEIVYDNPAEMENTEVPNFFADADPVAETAEETVAPVIQKIEDVENPIPGEWYEIDGTVKQYEAPVAEPEVETEKLVEDVIPEVEPEVIPETPAPDAKPESEKPAEEPKENKRRQGKGIVAYKNGEEMQTFPSIKATATYFKDLLNLGHMPFTPIMKSVRQGVDWNEYSFKHENEADLHIPESLKKKIEESKQKASEEKATTEQKPVAETDTETAEKPADEVIEEIIEEVIEEPVAEITETVDEKSEETVETK